MTEVQKIAARIVAAKKLAADPDYFSKMSKMAKKPRGGKAASGSFKPGTQRTKRLTAKGGRNSKRGKAKDSLKDYKMGYEEL